MTTAAKIYPLFQSKFKRVRQLGQGSYGKVYLCQKIMSSANGQTNLNHQNENNINNSNQQVNQNQQKTNQSPYCALKKLKPYIPKKNVSSLIPSIENYPEIFFLKKLAHPNLISLKQIVQSDKGYQLNHFLVMDFGIQLMQLNNHKEISLSAEQIRCLIKQLAEAIQYLHNRGIMHRDIKPSNIYLMEDGTLKLGDFSIMTNIQNQAPSQMISEQEEENFKKRTGNITTRHYRAPEIIYGSRSYDQSIDIWGLGCTIAELLLGQTLFPGTTDIHQLELIFGIIGFPQHHWPQASQLPYYLQFDCSKPALGLSNLIPNAPKELLNIIQKCLNINPSKRPNINQLLEDTYFMDLPQNSRLQLGKVCNYLHQKILRQTKSNV